MSNEALKNAVAPEQEPELSSQEIMANLNDEERSRYVALQETFETDGWKILAQYATAKAFEAGVRGANAATWEACKEAYGERMAWQEVESLDTSMLKAFENLALANIAETEQPDDLDDLTAE